MEMKINFDQIFDTGNQAELNSTVESPFIELSHQMSSSLNNSLQYKYVFNNRFFDSEDFDQRQEVGLELDQEFSEFDPPPKSVKSIKKSVTNVSNKSQKPGERLFYESQQIELRKMYSSSYFRKEREKLQQEKQIELSKIVTFVPTINENSRKMAERQKQVPKTKTMKAKDTLKSTVELREEQSKKECTFQPKLVAKNKNQVKSKEELFYYLHNTSKIKDMKINKLTNEQYGQFDTNSKKGNQEGVNNFLKRNEEYTSLVKKKQQILKTNSQKYDLKTGEKLFSPKIGDNKAFNFHSTCAFKQTKSDCKQLRSYETAEKQQPRKSATKPRSGIFNKKYIVQDVGNDEINGLRYRTSSKQDGEDNYGRGSEDLEQKYRQYSKQYDKLNSQGKVQREVILEEQENSGNDHEKNYSKIQQSDQFNPDHVDDEIQGEDLNVWGSNQIKPFELSNVNQYLNASEQDEQEHKNNYVMQILNNLMIKHDEEL